MRFTHPPGPGDVRMYRCGLLVLGWPSQGRCLAPLSGLLTAASKHVAKTLYIHMVPDGLLAGNTNTQAISTSSELHQFLMRLYGHTASCANRVDVRVLLSNLSHKPPTSHRLRHGYDVIFLPREQKDSRLTLEKYVCNYFPNDHPISCDILDEISSTMSSDNQTSDVNPKFNNFKAYDHTVIGGTFDHIHTGHKLLLTESCLRSRESLTIGVTDGAMNEKKTLCELIQPVEARIAALHEFLGDVQPQLEYKIVPIHDPFGPSIVDARLQCIVVSEETVKGGDAVNKRRKDKGLSILDMHEISLVEDASRSQEEEVKISSSSLRKRQLGRLRRAPLHDRLVGSTSYVIGLTGGIASGKSSVCRRLEKLGAAVVDCDKLGHAAYLKGSDAFRAIVATFGDDVIGEDGEINRRALGGKVFGNKDELEKLNQIVWPAIAELAKDKMASFAEQGYRVVILDAAVLLEAGWQSLVNEVWVAIIPRDEAMRRIVARNGLSEAESLKRIDSQLTNSARVEQAHVVLSTLWEPEVTQKQVEVAWTLLQERLPKEDSNS